MAQRLQFRRGTAALATSNNVVLGDGELGYESDTRKFKIGDGVTAWNALPYTGLIGTELTNYPIGYVYWQLPGKSSPADMSLPGTWVNISTEFAGDFFRAEGGNASVFESGQQADDFKSHTHVQDSHNHTQNPHSHLSAPPALNYTGGQLLWGYGSATAKNSVNNNNTARTAYPYTQSTTATNIEATATNQNTGGTETRPVNRTIRLWERTA